MRQLITRLTSGGAHPSFARIVCAVSESDQARLTASDRAHLSACTTCATRLADVQAVIGGSLVTDARPNLRAEKLLDTLNGLRVTSVLASWLGPDTASALLRDARTGPHAKADVLMAIAEPLTTFLGEEAGGALALQISQLAQSERDCEWELHR